MTPWGSYLTFEVSSAEPDEDPVWVDLTDRVLDVGRVLSTWLGRDSELDSPEPGGMSVQLRNRDDALTPGNPTSPYYPWWKQARRFRIREVIGYLGFDLADGYLEIPEVQVRTQDPNDDDSDVTLSVTAVDILGRLQNTGRFLSTLAAHIRWAGGNTLVGYWPLGDATEPVQSYPSGNSLKVTQAQYSSGAVTPTDPALPSITFRGAPSLPGDDLSPIDFQPSRDVTFDPHEFVRSYTLEGEISFTISSGQVMTLVAWIRPDDLYRLGYVFAMSAAPGFAAITWDLAGAVLRGVAGDGVTWDGEILGAHPGYGRWVPVALRCGFNPSVLELWIGNEVYTGSMFVAGGSATTYTSIDVGTQFDGGIAHVQVYIGTEDDWTYDDYLAQYDVGLNGLERQTTGQRVASVLDYAGFPPGRRDIDPGVAVMQVASLAGKRPLQALEEATETEQGRLFAQGGRVAFHDRRRVLDT